MQQSVEAQHHVGRGVSPHHLTRQIRICVVGSAPSGARAKGVYTVRGKAGSTALLRRLRADGYRIGAVRHLGPAHLPLPEGKPYRQER